jgi:hypothetical protein
MNKNIDQKTLMEWLTYEQETGLFIWNKHKTRSKVQAGDVAGTKNVYGYIQIKINRTVYLAHRLAWLYVYGYMPTKHTDHINGIGTDNRIVNLREASASENQMNVGMRSNNKSGANGVHFETRSKTWVAQAGLNGKRHKIGSYKTLDEAISARKSFEDVNYGEYAHRGNNNGQ